MSDAPLADTCACGRDATLGRRTCPRCRCVALGARLSPADRFDHLDDAAAVVVERCLLEGEAAFLRARARAAVAAGAATHDAPVPGENAVTRTFTVAARPEGVAMPGFEVRRG